MLERLIERELVARLRRRPGQREERYMHLLGGDAPTGGGRDGGPLAPAADDRLDAASSASSPTCGRRSQALREAIGA